MPLKKTKKAGKQLIVAGATLGAGTYVVEKIPRTPAGVTTGLSTMGGYFPMMANVTGTGILVHTLNKSFPKPIKTKRKKRKF